MIALFGFVDNVGVNSAQRWNDADETDLVVVKLGRPQEARRHEVNSYAPVEKVTEGDQRRVLHLTLGY